ncbi:MAG: hypothetical protein ACOH13_08885 [Flavobacteriales bacterium]
MKFITAILLLACTTSAFAQHSIITEYDRGGRPIMPDSVQEMADHSVLLRRNVIVDHVEEGDQVVEYLLTHIVTYLKDNTGIEQNNTVQIGLGDLLDVVSIKARSFKPDGTVLELPPDAFKRAHDEEKKENYLYFAYEGLVPGSMTDYVCVLKQSPELRGSRTMMQFAVPILHERLDLVGPARLVMVAKEYNGLPPAVIDTTDAEQQHLCWALSNVPALKEEPSSAPLAERMQVIFALDRIPDIGLKNYSGYVGATKTYHNVLYPDLSSKTRKALTALLKEAKVSFARDEEDKVRTLECYIKDHFSLRPAGPGARDLDLILKDRTCDVIGMNILYCTLLAEMGVEHQVVITSDRVSSPFDPTFENYFYLQDVHLYFPKLKKYLAPTEFDMRLGWLPWENMDNAALFIRNYTIGTTTTGVGKIGFIDALPDTLNAHDIFAHVVLNEDASSATVTFENRLSGYFANGIQAYYAYMNEDQRKKLEEGLLGFLTDNSSTHEVRVENGDAALQGSKPLILHATVETSKFSGSAGEKRLFNIGELIGPQTEMYSENTRKLPVNERYARRFHRELEVVIPKGWSIANAADLVMEHHLDADGERLLQFTSTWRTDGDTIKVNIDENYRRCQLPVEQFGTFRQVVNAAADWNKLKLVLVKD